MRMPISVPLIVTTQIEGPAKTGMVHLVMDTGARYLTLGWSVAEDMGFDPATSQNRVSLVTANGIVHAPLIVAPRVRVGDVWVEDVEIVCHDIPQILPLVGLLGMSYLQQTKFTFDFKDGFFELIDP